MASSLWSSPGWYTRLRQYVKYLFSLLDKGDLLAYTPILGNRKASLTTHREERFFASTRGQVVTLLRRSDRTVEDLAWVLGLTDNGVRAHLTVLERDGIVRQRGVVRRGSGKPAYVYGLTPQAEELFSKAYRPVLRELLDVMAERVGSEETEVLLRAVGSRMADADGRDVPAGGIRARLEAGVALLNELGGLAELEEHGDTVLIRGYSCPLTAVVAGHPEVCRMIESLLTELTSVPIHEHCDRGDSPRCCFEAALAGDAGRNTLNY